MVWCGTSTSHDGYRLIVRRDSGAVRLFTRRGHDWTERYPAIAGAAAKLRAKSFTLDGEPVVCGPDGLAVFDAAVWLVLIPTPSSAPSSCATIEIPSSAFTTDRSSVVRGRPRPFAGNGSNGSITAHSSSVVSLA